MFEGFTLEERDVAGVRFRLRRGGEGPAILLLHGHPRTHTTWHRVAPILARSFTVVCPDLPGFGRSTLDRDRPEREASSKRAKANALVALMRTLGHERFGVAGHDRGSYTAFRLAMDHPACVERLALLDGVPIIEALERCGEKFATLWWHWFFFCQPDKPEAAIMADPDRWYGGDIDAMGAQNHADFRTAINDPAVVRTMLEDYRAGPTIDRVHDAEDRRTGHTLACPTLCLWTARDDLETLYGDVLAVWRPWAPTLEGASIDCGHHVAEERPEELAKRLNAFFRTDCNRAVSP